MAYHESVGDKLQIAGIEAALGGYYLNIGNFTKAVSTLEQCRRFFEANDQSLHLVHLYSNLAEAYYETGDLDSAHDCVDRCLRYENAGVTPYAYYTLGLIHQSTGQVARAQTIFAQAINIAQENRDRFIEAYLQRSLGELYLKQGEPDRATPMLQTASHLFKEMGIETDISKK